MEKVSESENNQITLSNSRYFKTNYSPMKKFPSDMKSSNSPKNKRGRPPKSKILTDSANESTDDENKIISYNLLKRLSNSASWQEDTRLQFIGAPRYLRSTPSRDNLDLRVSRADKNYSLKGTKTKSKSSTDLSQPFLPIKYSKERSKSLSELNIKNSQPKRKYERSKPSRQSKKIDLSLKKADKELTLSATTNLKISSSNQTLKQSEEKKLTSHSEKKKLEGPQKRKYSYSQTKNSRSSSKGFSVSDKNSPIKNATRFLKFPSPKKHKKPELYPL